MPINTHFHIDIDKEKPEYNEHNFLFKLFPNISVEHEKEYKTQNYIMIRLEWLFWSYVLYYKSKKDGQ